MTLHYQNLVPELFPRFPGLLLAQARLEHSCYYSHEQHFAYPVLKSYQELKYIGLQYDNVSFCMFQQLLKKHQMLHALTHQLVSMLFIIVEDTEVIPDLLKGEKKHEKQGIRCVFSVVARIWL